MSRRNVTIVSEETLDDVFGVLRGGKYLLRSGAYRWELVGALYNGMVSIDRLGWGCDAVCERMSGCAGGNVGLYYCDF